MTQMTHREALEELAVERYLLDELQGDARDRFEEHLFDCMECAADLKAGLLFREAAKKELRAEAPQATPAATRLASPIREWFSRLFQPLVLAPALAASLCVIAYQSAVVLPRVESQLAEVHTPSVIDTLVLANAGPRGDGSAPEVSASPHGVYSLAVDLPPAPGASAYRFTLLGPSGKAAWHTDLPTAEAKDAVTIQVPVDATAPGINLLMVQAVHHAPGSQLMDLATYRFNVQIRDRASNEKR